MSDKRIVSFVRVLKTPEGNSPNVDEGPSGAEGVRLAWELSLEQWALSTGRDEADQPMQKSVVKLTRR